MSTIKKIIAKGYSIFDRFNDGLAVIAGVMLIAMAIMINANVISRYILHRPFLHILAIAQIFAVFITFMVAAWILRQDQHIRMDYLISRFKPEHRYIIELITDTLSIFVCAVLAWFGTLGVLAITQRGIRLEGSLKILRGPLTAVIPMSLFLCFVDLLRRTYKDASTLRKLRSRQPSETITKDIGEPML